MPRMKKRKLSRLLANAVLTQYAVGDFNSMVDQANRTERKALVAYDYYIQNFGDTLVDIVADYIKERLSRALH